MGDAASFSFYPGKNLGAYGDAGARVTNDEQIAETARLISNHGQKAKHDHCMEGRNSRLDAIQSAVRSVKLKYLDSWNAKRREVANQYAALLKMNGIKVTFSPEYSKHVYHLYVIQVNERNKTIDYLTKKNIGTAIHYPSSLPFMKPYVHLKFQEKDFPIASAFQGKIISLPMFPEIANSQIQYVAENIVRQLTATSSEVTV